MNVITLDLTMWWIVATLILAGIIFMLIEMLLIPGVGVAGIFSLASLGAACWYSFTFLSPVVGRWVTILVIVILVVMLFFILREKTWKRLELKTEIDSKVNDEVKGVKISDRGTALTRLAPMGTAVFGDVRCEAKSADNSMIDPGTPLEVVGIEDGKAIVKPITNE